MKVTFVTCEKIVVQFDSTMRRRFSPGTPFSSCRNNEPMRGCSFWTSRENNLKWLIGLSSVNEDTLPLPIFFYSCFTQ